jgi:peptidoglycan/xylan/chitin deacetylase (PgdA/CDA1 family)
VTRRGFLGAAAASAAQDASFSWPAGKRAAISLTFDDARLSQVDSGLALLDRAGAKATFYLTGRNIERRLDGWKRAAGSGHEMANHSQTHPCTGNYRFSAGNALEDYTLERMERDLDTASAEIERLLGVKPVSFAYPCGLKFVGRGQATRSYVPLVARRFLTGRGYLDEAPNDPAVCDLAQLMGTAFDGLGFAEMEKLVSAAAQEGRWIVFVGHDIGKPARQTTDAAALEQLCRFAKDPANGIWIETVAAIAKYVDSQRRRLKSA